MTTISKDGTRTVMPGEKHERPRRITAVRACQIVAQLLRDCEGEVLGEGDCPRLSSEERNAIRVLHSYTCGRLIEHAKLSTTQGQRIPRATRLTPEGHRHQ